MRPSPVTWLRWLDTIISSLAWITTIPFTVSPVLKCFTPIWKATLTWKGFLYIHMVVWFIKRMYLAALKQIRLAFDHGLNGIWFYKMSWSLNKSFHSPVVLHRLCTSGDASHYSLVCFHHLLNIIFEQQGKPECKEHVIKTKQKQYILHFFTVPQREKTTWMLELSPPGCTGFISHWWKHMGGVNRQSWNYMCCWRWDTFPYIC